MSNPSPDEYPFAAASPSITVTHRAKNPLPMRLPISSALRNIQKQLGLQRHENILRDTHVMRLSCPMPPCHLFQ